MYKEVIDILIKTFLQRVLGETYVENRDNLVKINNIIIAFLYCFSAIILIFLPQDMPMQWSFDGSVNYTLPSIMGVWVIPTIILLTNFTLIKRKRVNLINTSVLLFASIIYIFIYIKII